MFFLLCLTFSVFLFFLVVLFFSLGFLFVLLSLRFLDVFDGASRA